MGDQVLYFEDVDEGDEAPERTHVLNRTDLVMYAGASGDYNPMHHDEVKAQAAGQPSVFGHGMFSMGLLGSAITDYVGIGNVRRFQVRFAKQTWPDEELRTRIVVTGKQDRRRRAPGRPGCPAPQRRRRGEGGGRGHRRTSRSGLSRA